MTYSRIRRGPMAADNFTQISNTLFRDPRLSAKAKGIFGFISTHREGWGITPETISAAMTDGVSAIKTGLRELERYGYLVRDQPRRPDGTRGPVVYCITDQPSSEPLVEIQSPGAKCDDAETPRSEPVVENPLAAEPLAADRPHKKINSKDTNPKDTTTPLPSPSSEPPAVVEAQGGGGDSASPDEQQRATAFVDGLPYGGRLPGRKTRAHLIGRVAGAMAAGWSERALRVQLTGGTDGAKSLAAVYRYRLGPDELPDAPVSVPRAVVPVVPPPAGEVTGPNDAFLAARKVSRTL